VISHYRHASPSFFQPASYRSGTGRGDARREESGGEEAPGTASRQTKWMSGRGTANGGVRCPQKEPYICRYAPSHSTRPSPANSANPTCLLLPNSDINIPAPRLGGPFRLGLPAVWARKVRTRAPATCPSPSLISPAPLRRAHRLTRWPILEQEHSAASAYVDIDTRTLINDRTWHASNTTRRCSMKVWPFAFDRVCIFRPCRIRVGICLCFLSPADSTRIFP
jgi:hypothetical protein